MSDFLHLSNSLIDLGQSLNIRSLRKSLQQFDGRLRDELLKLGIRLMKIEDRLDQLEGKERKPVRRMKTVPSTQCTVCGKPAVMQLVGKWYCEEHLGSAW